MTKHCFLFGLLLLFVGGRPDEQPKPPALLPNPDETLQLYRQNLVQLRQQYPTPDSLPDLTFFLFGMGNRMKLIYRNGRLLNARTGHIEWQWEVEREIIVPSEYAVQLDLHAEPGAPPRSVQIREDETGVWLLQTGKRPQLLRGTRHRLTLPRYANNPNGPVLRVLLQEVLMNVMDGKPLSNFLVYDQPILQDASRMLTVLQMTGNDALMDGKIYVAPERTEQDVIHLKNEIGTVDYPLSWQRNAPGAHYPGLTVLEKTLVKQRLILPQAGQAAGLFLQLSER